jgi:hypothetical protein
MRDKAEEPRARALVQQAELLSRRNLATELWLIEDAVRREDVPGALRHFDVALRTSKIAGGLLYPVLREALEDPQLTRPIAQTLSVAPWRSQFLQYAVSLNRPSVALASIFQQQRNLEPFQGTDLKGALVGQLLARKSYDSAARLALGKPAGLVQDSGFAQETGFPPFNWQLADGDGLSSLRLQRAGGSALQITAQSDAAGPAAVQLIHAAPGLYMFVATMPDSNPGLIARLVCADTERELATISLGSRTAVTVTVPAGCAYQTLSIVALPSDTGTRSWQLTRVELLPIPASERQ